MKKPLILSLGILLWQFWTVDALEQAEADPGVDSSQRPPPVQSRPVERGSQQGTYPWKGTGGLEHVSSLRMSSHYTDIFGAADCIYAISYWGLEVYSASDPKHPQKIGEIPTPGLAQDLYVSDGHAYVADHDTGLTVIDVSQPTHPRLAASIETGRRTQYGRTPSARGVYVTGGYAYVAQAPSQLVVVDIQQPDSPRIVGRVDTRELQSGIASGVHVSGDHAYVVGGKKLMVIDVSQPEEPKIAASVETPVTAGSIYVSGNYAYLGRSEGWSRDETPTQRKTIAVIDISRPQNPQVATTFVAPGHVNGICALGRYAYATYGNTTWKGGGLAILDITEPKRIRVVGTLATDGAAQGVHVSGDHAYVSSLGSILVADVSQPEKPQWVNTVGTARSGFIACVSVLGNYAYVTGADGAKFSVIDVSVAEAPQVVAEIEIPHPATKIHASENHAYIAFHGKNGLGIVDISEPKKPRLVGQGGGFFRRLFGGTLTRGYAWDVHVSGSHAYVADGDKGLTVVDVSNPSTPKRVGSFDTLADARSVFASGRYAYVADRLGLQVLDVSEPEDPKLAGNWKGQGSLVGCVDVHVSGNYAYLAARRRGVAVVDVSRPENPRLVRLVNTRGEAQGVAVSDGHIYVANNFQGLAVIKDGWIEASIETPGLAQDVAVSGEYIYVADATALSIFRFQKPQHATSEQVADSLGLKPGQAVKLERRKPQIGDITTSSIRARMVFSGMPQGPFKEISVEEQRLRTGIVTDVSADGVSSQTTAHVRESARMMADGRDMSDEVPDGPFESSEPFEISYRKRASDGRVIEETSTSSSEREAFQRPIGPMEVPDRPVRIGDTWTQTAESPSENVETTFTLARFERVNGYNCARIEGEIAGTFRGPEGKPLKIEKAAVVHFFGVDEGVTVESEADLQMSFELPTGARASVAIEMRMQLADRKKLTPKELEAARGELKQLEAGLAHVTKGNKADARIAFERFLKEHPDSRWHSAVEELLEEPDDRAAVGRREPFPFEQMRKYRERGELDEMLEYAEKRMKTSPSDSEMLRRELVRAFSQHRRLEELIAHFQEKLKANAADIDAYKILGEAYQRSRDRAKAVEMYERVIALAPNDSGAHRSLARLYQQHGAHEKATAAYQKALKTLDARRAYERPRIVQEMIQSLVALGDIETVVAVYLQYISEIESAASWTMYYSTGEVYTAAEELRRNILGRRPRSGTLAALASAFETRLSESPDDRHVLQILADIYVGQEKLDKAVEAYDKLTKLVPDDPILFAWLASAQHGSGKRSASEATLEQLKQLPLPSAPSRRFGPPPDHYVHYMRLSRIYRWGKLYTHAIDAHKKAIELIRPSRTSQLERTRRGLAELYREAGDPERAAEIEETLPPRSRVFPPTSRPSQETIVGKSAPDFVLRDLDEKEVRLAEFKGKVIVLDFWATWCGPCVMEVPHFVELHKEYRDQGFAVVGISVDTGIGVVKPFVQQHQVNYPVLMADGKVQEAYGGIRAYPTTFLIDKSGTVRRQYVGYRDKAVFEAAIKALLEGRPLPPERITSRTTPSSLEEFRQALELRPRDHWLHESFGAFLIEKRDYEKAFSELRLAFELNRSCRRTRNLIRELILTFLHEPKDEAPERALSCARLLVEESGGKDSDMLSLLKEVESFAVLKGRVDKDPSDLEAVLGLARTYREHRKYPEAEKLYNQILEAEKTTASMRNQAEGGLVLIAFLKSGSQKIEEIERYFEKNKHRGDAVDHARHLFEHHRKQENTSKLIEVGDYLLRHGSDEDASFLNNYAWYLALHDAELEKALELAKRAVQLSPEAYILDTLAETYARNSMHEEAVATQEEAVKKALGGQRKQFEERLEGFKKAMKESNEK